MLRKLRIKPFFFILFVLIPLLTSCGFKDIDKNAFVSAIGIDRSDHEDKPYKVTLKLFVPTSSFKQQSEPQYAFITKEGKTIGDAIRLMEAESEKKLELGHSKIILFGEDILEKDLKEMADYLMRRADIQLISWVAVGRPSAEEILMAQSATESATYPSLYNFFDATGTLSPYIVTTNLFEFRRTYLEKGVHPVLPIIVFDQKESNYKIDKSLILVKKGERVELSPEETKIFNILLNFATKTDITIQDGSNFSALASIDKYKTKLKIRYNESGKATVIVDLSMIGTIIESGSTIRGKELPEVDRMAEEELKEDLTKFLKKISEEGADPLGLGLKYRSSRLHQNIDYKQWQQAYRHLNIDLNIKVSLKSTGMTY
ncbi:Ger(x)C family spore germination protein [Chungangia koreensis]|uniref:Ger(X)C family spore germination protein n=1 Tax=Chungangia koreensis TaxID=752657 RepID=A0ABV8X4R7_9LACT